jgi:hypothetical protein
MEDLKSKAETLTDHVGDYIELYYKLIVLNATEKATGMASISVTSLTIAFLSVFSLLFISLGVGWWIGEQLGSMLGGFSIIGGFYAIVVVLILAFRKKIVPSIQNLIIRKVYEESDNIVSGPDRTETRITKAA